MLKNILTVVIACFVLSVAANRAKSSNNSEPAPRAAAATDTIDIKETYVDSLTLDENGKNPQLGYGGTATISGTMALPNQSGANVTADTIFKLSAGAYSTTFRVGDDPKFKDKAKKAATPSQTVEVDFSDGKKPKKIKASLSISWKPDSLKFKIVVAETDGNKIQPVFATLRKTQGNGGHETPVISIKISFGTDSVAYDVVGDANVDVTPVDVTPPVTVFDWVATASKK